MKFRYNCITNILILSAGSGPFWCNREYGGRIILPQNTIFRVTKIYELKFKKPAMSLVTVQEIRVNPCSFRLNCVAADPDFRPITHKILSVSSANGGSDFCKVWCTGRYVEILPGLIGGECGKRLGEKFMRN